jgi:hypothetical protein
MDGLVEYEPLDEKLGLGCSVSDMSSVAEEKRPRILGRRNLEATFQEDCDRREGKSGGNGDESRGRLRAGKLEPREWLPLALRAAEER